MVHLSAWRLWLLIVAAPALGFSASISFAIHPHDDPLWSGNLQCDALYLSGPGIEAVYVGPCASASNSASGDAGWLSVTERPYDIQVTGQVGNLLLDDGTVLETDFNAVGESRGWLELSGGWGQAWVDFEIFSCGSNEAWAYFTAGPEAAEPWDRYTGYSLPHPGATTHILVPVEFGHRFQYHLTAGVTGFAPFELCPSAVASITSMTVVDALGFPILGAALSDAPEPGTAAMMCAALMLLAVARPLVRRRYRL